MLYELQTDFGCGKSYGGIFGGTRKDVVIKTLIKTCFYLLYIVPIIESPRTMSFITLPEYK